jgi:type 1 fimbria pilin
MKKTLFGAVMAAISMLILSRTARADSLATSTSSPNVVDNLCSVTAADIAVIQNIQGNSALDYNSEIKQELAARKALLIKTIQCAQNNALQLQEQLNGTTIDPSLISIKNQLSDNLSGAVSYYNIQIQNTSNSGIMGTKLIARDILTWRNNNYVPLAENVVNFIAWSDNQALFSAASTRLNEINALISSPLFSENKDLQVDYEEAAASLNAAEGQNSNAKNSFAQSLSPDQTLLYVKQSLTLLSETYQHFFDISTIIQSLIPQ